MMSSNARSITFWNGNTMPIIGLGTYQRADGADLEKTLESAVEAGYRHFDTAYAYKNEAIIGKTLKKLMDAGKVKREELFIVTKLPPQGNRASSVEKYLKLSLEALQMDYVDLYLIHTPYGLKENGVPGDPNSIDMETDHVSTWKAMEAQVDAGRARSIGLSNFNSRQIKRIVENARIRPANLQIELNVYIQRRELVAFCNALDITVCAFGALGSPEFADFFVTAYKGDTTVAENIKKLAPLKDPVVLKIAQKHNKTPGQILLKHVMQRGIAAIPKSSNPARLRENIQIFDFNLEPDDIDQLNSLDTRKSGNISTAVTLGLKKHPEFSYDDRY